MAGSTKVFAVHHRSFVLANFFHYCKSFLNGSFSRQDKKHLIIFKVMKPLFGERDPLEREINETMKTFGARDPSERGGGGSFLTTTSKIQAQRTSPKQFGPRDPPVEGRTNLSQFLSGETPQERSKSGSFFSSWLSPSSAAEVSTSKPKEFGERLGGGTSSRSAFIPKEGNYSSNSSPTKKEFGERPLPIGATPGGFIPNEDHVDHKEKLQHGMTKQQATKTMTGFGSKNDATNMEKKEFGERPSPSGASTPQVGFISTTKGSKNTQAKPSKDPLGSTTTSPAKEFGERPRTSGSSPQVGFISTKHSSRVNHHQGGLSLSSGTTTTTPKKEFGERNSDVTTSVMEKELQHVVISKDRNHSSNSPPRLSPTNNTTSNKKRFGEKQRCGNEGWTQDKYLMTIKKTDHPTEKERKLQLEKQMQKQLATTSQPTSIKPTTTPTKKIETRSPPTQQNIVPKSLGSSSAAKSSSAGTKQPMKQFGERGTTLDTPQFSSSPPKQKQWFPSLFGSTSGQENTSSSGFKMQV